MAPGGPAPLLLLLLLTALPRGAPQVFVEEPDNTTVQAGGEAALRCRVQALAGLAQWAKDGLLLGPSRDLPGFPRYSLTGDASKGELHLRIVGARLEDDGRYECQAAPGPDGHTWVSRPALLTVLVPPQAPVFAEQKPDSIVSWVAGEEQTVTCSAPDAQPPAQVTLARGDQPLPEASSHVEPGSHEKLSTTKATVRFTPEILDNGRRLLCEALNEAISTPLLSSFIMNILYPPQPPTIEGLQRSEVKAGEILKLTCVSVGGNPLATLQWIKAGAVVSTTWATAGGAGASRSTLILTVQPEDYGAELSCEALSPLLPAPLRASLSLNVLYPPAEVMLHGVGSTPENGTLELSCSAGPSRPPATLRWWLGGRELPPSDGSVIPDAHGGVVTVSNVSVLARRSADGLTLTCEAFNSALRLSRAASLVLAITYPPERLWLEAPPPEPPLRAGTPLRLRCYVTGGSPTPRLIWMKDSRVLREGTQVSSGRTVSKELLLTAAPSDNMAAYRCNASNDAKGAPLSALTRLRVQFPPIQVKITPSPPEVRRGQALTLTCVAGSANPFATITWFKEGKRLQGTDLGRRAAEYGGISTSGRVSLVVSTTDNGQRVTCQAQSPILGEAMNTFYQLDVKYRPEFSAEQPELVVGQEHGAVDLPLLVSGNPPDLTCTWSFRGKDLIPEGSPRHHQVGPGKSLAVWNVTRADAGPYRAQCSNKEGANETLLHLLVHYAPSIRSLSDPTVVAEGAVAEIVCVADAVPAPPGMFQWTWLGPEERDLDDLEAVAVGAVGRLRVPAARRDQAGRYECRVDNGVGAPARASARLIVHFPPELERGPGWEKIAAPGDGSAVAVLRCRARGVPGVELSWTKGGIALDPEEPRYSTRSWREGPWYLSDLVIANVSAAADYAMFTCTAANTLGSAHLDVQLLSTSHPDPPTGLQVVGVTPTSVSLAWTPGFDGGLRQQFRIRYRWPGAPSASYVDVFPGAASAFTLTSLHPGMPYSLAVTSRNALGESPPTPELHITTHELLGEPPPEEEPTLHPPEEGSFALPLLWGLGAVGGGLLLSNAALVLCMLRRRRGASEGMAERKKLSAENHYSPGEAVNPGARRTLLLDSGSEGSAPSFGNHWPGLYPHPETPQYAGPAPWPYPPHHYEDLLEPYEEVGVSPAPPARWGLAPWGGPEDPWGIYDRVAETVLPGPEGVSELPFELRGELV